MVVVTKVYEKSFVSFTKRFSLLRKKHIQDRSLMINIKNFNKKEIK